MLLYGKRSHFSLLGREPDFLVLTASAQEHPNLAKAKVSLPIMAAVLLPVMMGWLPIYLSAVIGAAIMVLTRCLTMEDAYRAISWSSIVLIAGMLPVALALESTGGVDLIVDALVGGLGDFGPHVMLVALFVLGTAATRMGHHRKARIGVSQERGGRRGARHALANTGVGVAAARRAASPIASSTWSVWPRPTTRWTTSRWSDAAVRCRVRRSLSSPCRRRQVPVRR